MGMSSYWGFAVIFHNLQEIWPPILCANFLNIIHSAFEILYFWLARWLSEWTVFFKTGKLSQPLGPTRCRGAWTSSSCPLVPHVFHEWCMHARTHKYIHLKIFFKSITLKHWLYCFIKRLLFKPLISHISFTFFRKWMCPDQYRCFKKCKITVYLCQSFFRVSKRNIKWSVQHPPSTQLSLFFQSQEWEKQSIWEAILKKKSTVQEKFNTHDF